MIRQFDRIRRARADEGENGPRLVAENARGLMVKNLGKNYERRPVVRGVSLGIQRG